MKKSKIIAPALGVLLLSTAASVSGTVAWFTSNRAATVAASVFRVANMEGNLSCAVSAVNSETIMSFDNSAATKDVTFAGALTDASYDADTDALYTKILNADGTAITDAATKYKAVDYAKAGSKTVAGNTYDIYYAAHFNITFSYRSAADADASIGLYFDPVASTATATSTGDHKIKSAFRMAFTWDAGFMVWAPFYSSSVTIGETPTDNNLNRVTSVSAVAAYPSVITGVGVGATVTGTGALTDVSGATAANTTGKNFIKVIGNTGTDLVVKCTVWYEGNDVSCIDDFAETAESISTSLSFKARNVAA